MRDKNIMYVIFRLIQIWVVDLLTLQSFHLDTAMISFCYDSKILPENLGWGQEQICDSKQVFLAAIADDRVISVTQWCTENGDKRKLLPATSWLHDISLW